MYLLCNDSFSGKTILGYRDFYQYYDFRAEHFINTLFKGRNTGIDFGVRSVKKTQATERILNEMIDIENLIAF